MLADKDYVAWRERLIPLAEAEADVLCPEPPQADRDDEAATTVRNVWSLKWDRAFHDAMRRFTTDPFLVLGN